MGKKRTKKSETPAPAVSEQDEIDFYGALAVLPDAADPVTEKEWIDSHPAMLRKNRTGVDRIVITDKDIIDSPNGPAPSKQAVYQLQHWANDPAYYFKQSMSAKPVEQQEEEEDPQFVEDLTLSSVRVMIADIARTERRRRQQEKGQNNEEKAVRERAVKKRKKWPAIIKGATDRGHLHE